MPSHLVTTTMSPASIFQMRTIYDPPPRRSVKCNIFNHKLDQHSCYYPLNTLEHLPDHQQSLHQLHLTQTASKKILDRSPTLAEVHFKINMASPSTSTPSMINPITNSNMTGVSANTGPRLNRDATCTICQEEMTASSRTLVHTVSCGSAFHARCLHESLTRDGKCPNCRVEIHRTLTLDEKLDIFSDYFESRNEVLSSKQGNDSEDTEWFRS